MKDFTIDELSSAFKSIQNITNWRDPIVSVIPEDKRKLVQAAVDYFTATEAKFYPVYNPEGNCIIPGNRIIPGFLIVTSIGYRLGPAGDH